jgi:hypothetical protein
MPPPALLQGLTAVATMAKWRCCNLRPWVLHAGGGAAARPNGRCYEVPRGAAATAGRRCYMPSPALMLAVLQSQVDGYGCRPERVEAGDGGGSECGGGRRWGRVGVPAAPEMEAGRSDNFAGARGEACCWR